MCLFPCHRRSRRAISFSLFLSLCLVFSMVGQYHGPWPIIGVGEGLGRWFCFRNRLVGVYGFRVVVVRLWEVLSYIG